MKKIAILSGVLLSMLSASSAFASGTVRCETQYGGNQVCITTGAVQINKKVCDISTLNCDPDQNYKDNLGLNDHIFKAGEQVIYNLYVTNAGNDTLTVYVNDTLPAYLDLDTKIAGNTLNYTISNLQPGQTNKTRVTARVKAENFLQPGTNCILNTAKATSGDLSDQDTAQVCVSKPGVVATVPAAGPQDWFLLLPATLLLAGSGIYLKRFSK